MTSTTGTTQPTPSTQSTRISGVVADVFGPVPRCDDGTRRRLLRARSAVAYLGVVVTLVQVVVWLAIGVATGGLDTPWWLWTTVPAALAVVGLTAADRWRSWWTSTKAAA